MEGNLKEESREQIQLVSELKLNNKLPNTDTSLFANSSKIKQLQHIGDVFMVDISRYQMHCSCSEFD